MIYMNDTNVMHTPKHTHYCQVWVDRERLLMDITNALLLMEGSGTTLRVSIVSIVTFRECLLFIGTHYSNLYTAVDTPAEAAWCCV